MKKRMVGALYVLLVSLGCTEVNNTEAVARIEIVQFIPDSLKFAKRLYIVIHGVGKGPQGSLGRFVHQTDFENVFFPFKKDYPITDKMIRDAREKYDWKDSVTLFFDIDIDTNDDTSLCNDDYRTSGSQHIDFLGDLPASQDIKIQVKKIENEEFCEKLYPGMTIEKHPY